MERWFSKAGAAMGSGLPDPSTAPASSAPVPQPAFENKPPPGQRGPTGLSGRQTYSRVNTGIPPTPDAGQSQQKAMAPLGGNSLKTAQLENSMSTTAMTRPTLDDLIKTAMQASAEKIELSYEDARQVAGASAAQEKVASAKAAAASDDLPTEYLTKQAAALDFVAAELLKMAAEDGPGKGPGALEVSTPQGGGNPVDAGQQGQAHTQPPLHPGTGKLPGQATDPGNAMETNYSMQHKEQPEEPIKNEKKAQATLVNNLISLGLVKAAAADDGTIQLIPVGEMGKEAFGAHDLGSYVGSTTGGAAGGGLAGGVKGGLAGAAGGGLAGAAVGGLGGLLTGGAGGALSGAMAGGLGGAALGGVGGSALGAGVGGVKGGVKGYQRAAAGGEALAQQQAMQEQAAQQAAYEQAMAGKMAASPENSLVARNLMVVGLYKQAEDAINPAQISSPKAAATGAEPPPGAAPAEQEVPAEPSDVDAQKRKMISSNEAAINYTKRDAKADPKKDLGDVLVEPALTSATDKTLEKTLDHTGQAGVKISSVRTAAARAILQKLAADMDADEKKKKDGKGKEKESGMAPSTPAEASGFSANNPM